MVQQFNLILTISSNSTWFVRCSDFCKMIGDSDNASMVGRSSALCNDHFANNLGFVGLPWCVPVTLPYSTYKS